MVKGKGRKLGVAVAVGLGASLAGVVMVGVGYTRDDGSVFKNPVHRMMFKSLDLNGDDRIDKAEAASAEFSVGVKKDQTGPEVEKMNKMSKGDRFIYMFDRDRDGVVAATEFAAIVARGSKATECTDGKCGR